MSEDGKNNNHQKSLLKAYNNPEFLNSPDARELRILAEYLEPRQRLNKAFIKDTIVFYGSARTLSRETAEGRLAEVKSNRAHMKEQEYQVRLERAELDLKMSRYYEDARKLAFRLAKWSYGLAEDRRYIVCSGGGPGIMEAANRGASEAGGPTIGMNISIPFEQYPNPYISESLSFEFHYFFMRKFWFVYPAKALVVFPGGFGTFDELFELLTLRQTQKIKKPMCVIVYGKEFWDSVVDFEKMVQWGVIDREDLKLFHLVDTVDEAFEALTTHLTREFSSQNHYWHW